MDSISRAEVLSRIYATHSTGGFANEEAYLWLHGEITNLPSADVQPVKHGRWIDNGIAYTCSECNSSVPKNIFVVGCDFEGCPYCFARMDGGDIDASTGNRKES